MKSFHDIIDELSVRFLLFLSEEEKSYRERVYFVLEEAYWYFIDFMLEKHKEKYIRFKDFCKIMLQHNNFTYSDDDYLFFNKYKKEVPVYGAIIFNKGRNSILLVKGFNNDSYFFPKGKKFKDEDGKECAMREVEEEVNLDLRGLLSSIFINTSRGKFYFAFEMYTEFELKTSTRKEISSIKWFTLEEIEELQECKQVKDLLPSIREALEKYDRFRVSINF